MPGAPDGVPSRQLYGGGVVQLPPRHELSHPVIEQRNSHPPPVHDVLHTEPNPHSVTQPPPEHEKSHEAPVPHTKVHLPREHELLHDDPPSQRVEQGAPPEQEKSQPEAPRAHLWLTPPPPESEVPPSAFVAPTSQS